MRIKKVKLYTNRLEAELSFYTEGLGFELIRQEDNNFSIRIGWTEITFIHSERRHIYHYCFLLASNHLDSALAWFKERTAISPIADGQETVHFDHWNADSFYFYDASGNVAECIVRHDLNNPSDEDFTAGSILGLNEIGIPTKQISNTQSYLSEAMGSQAWRGDEVRFGTHGDQEGLLLLPNYLEKRTWFPTTLALRPEPIEATLLHAGTEYLLACRGGRMEVQKVG